MDQRRTAVGAAIVVAAVAAIGLLPAHGNGSDGHEHAGATAQVTDQQQARAAELIAGTRRELARYADVAAAEGAGYRWIGDGAGPGGYRHYVHPALLVDPVVLEPAQVESLVYRTEPGGALTLVSAMYILPPGRTMADAPDVAGDLTRWHEHTDLCWRPDGTLAGLVRTSGCPAGSTALPTPPMLHVWVVDNPGGPFAGIEGPDGPSHGH